MNTNKLLNSHGRLLDNYEYGLPSDYKLELLSRTGRFCEEANIFERIHEGKIKMFEPDKNLGGSYLFRVTTSPPEKVFESGFSREGLEIPTTYTHVYTHKGKKSDGYISTHKELGKDYEVLLNTWFREEKEGGFGWTIEKLKKEPLYVYTTNIRHLNAVDIESSPETFMEPLPKFNEKGDKIYDLAFTQKEVGVLGRIDSRDIKNVFKIEYDGKNITLTNLKKNEKYVISGWELPGVIE